MAVTGSLNNYNYIRYLNTEVCC